ncbi:MAG TPA: hypothetical protein DIT95_02630 [Arenibacter sp.]|nr:hypothetical protein [Arenibacter sp.]
MIPGKIVAMVRYKSKIGWILVVVILLLLLAPIFQLLKNPISIGPVYLFARTFYWLHIYVYLL